MKNFESPQVEINVGSPPDPLPGDHVVDLAEPATPPSVALAPTGTSPDAIVQLLALAVEKNVPVEMMERLQALHERVSDRNARVMFFEALSRFQEQCPSIPHSRKVAFVTSDGQQVNYSYAELDHIAKAINPVLKKLGLSYAWDSELKGETLTITCTLRHLDGHSEKSTFTCPTGSRSAMSPQQKIGAADTYGMRRSLVQVLGLTTSVADTDGVSPPEDGATPPALITEQQLHDLEALISESGRSVAAIMKWLKKSSKIEKLSELPADRFDAVCREIRDVMERERVSKAVKGQSS